MIFCLVSMVFLFCITFPLHVIFRILLDSFAWRWKAHIMRAMFIVGSHCGASPFKFKFHFYEILGLDSYGQIIHIEKTCCVSGGGLPLG